MENDIYRGDIFYIDYGQYTGSEQKAGRPAIVVSNDMNNAHSPTIEVVYLTTQPKEDLPTHVVIRATNKISTALCEQVTTVSKERVGKYISSCTESEIEAINRAIMISLQLEYAEETRKWPAPPPPCGESRAGEKSSRCGVCRGISHRCRARHLQRSVRTLARAVHRG